MILTCAAAFFLSSWVAAGSPATNAINSISQLSKGELLQLRKLYERYSEIVQKRRDDDWSYGLENGELIEHPEEARLPVRQIEEALSERQAEIKRLTAQKGKADSDGAAARYDAALAAKQAELKKLRRQLARSKGTCADWSDVVWAELMKAGADGWDLRDGPRRARPWHTAALACAPAGAETPTVCLAFDPWKTGTPEVYDFASWDDGSFEGRIAAEFFLHHLPQPQGS